MTEWPTAGEWTTTQQDYPNPNYICHIMIGLFAVWHSICINYYDCDEHLHHILENVYYMVDQMDGFRDID